MIKFRCPYCYEVHDLNDVIMRCSYEVSNSAKKTYYCVHKDDPKKQCKNPDGTIKNEFKKACTKCVGPRKLYFCPNTELQIPSNFITSGESMSIALLGARSSGKSNYIGVLINEIVTKMSSAFGSSITLTASDTSNSTYKNTYYTPLFMNKKAVPATSDLLLPPLIFPLSFGKKGLFGSSKNTILSFYDTAGENMTSSDALVENNKYIPNADGIILLLDPLQIPEVADKLRGKVSMPKDNIKVREVLDRIITNIRETTNNATGIINKSIALVFTKIDMLDDLGLLQEDSCLKHESEHMERGAFVNRDFEAVQIEMEDLLDNFLDESIIELLKSFKNYALFGVSALGATPDLSMNLPGGINPRRVLDPLLWLLSKEKYISTVKE